MWPGEIQGPALGFRIETIDDAGLPVHGRAGELEVSRPFPSMPIGFWNDRGGTRYKNTYFNHFPNVWRYGDWAQITERGGIIIFGRSDATLNAHGIRIGTAETCRALAVFEEIAESPGALPELLTE